MKRLLPLLLLAAVITIAGCGKKGGDLTPTPTATATASESASPLPSDDTPKPSIDTGGTTIERMSADEFAEEVINDSRTENAFIGEWYATGTTSDNASFATLEITITRDDYTVTMTFDNYDGSATYNGGYTLKNGVLTFDENFADCTAYFYKSDHHTLVLDNGSSLVFCEHLEQESEMR